MLEYTEAYLKPFTWAKQAYNYMLNNLSTDVSVNINLDQLTSPIVNNLGVLPSFINTSTEWNNASNYLYSNVGAIYKSIDQADSYISGLYTQLNARLIESEKRLKEIENGLKIIQTGTKYSASTSIGIKGGSTDLIESSDKYYIDYPPLENVDEEHVFRLKDTGFFSSIRSLGGFAGRVVVENTLTQIFESGSIYDIVDGDRNSFWSAITYSPNLIRANNNDIAWLPDSYKQGMAIQVTYYLDRPTLATEVFIDPVTTEPFDLVSVSWTPASLTTSIASSFSYWRTSGTVLTGTAYGIAGDVGAVVSAPTGYVRYTFAIPSSTASVSGETGLPIGRRAEVNYSMKGLGNLYSGARLVWIDSSSRVINYKLKEDFPPGFFSGYKLIDFIPTNAASGYLDLGIFTSTSNASAYFASPSLLLGEESSQISKTISSPTTVSLDKTVLSNRFTFVISQINPRRETLVKPGVNTPVPKLNIDSTVNALIKDNVDLLESKGPGVSLFSYRFGIKELDLRYREHLPRGSVVSLPLKSKREIRQAWVTTEVDGQDGSQIGFKIYPYADDVAKSINIVPFFIGSPFNNATSPIQDGKILYFYTDEERDAGWPKQDEIFYITTPIPIKEVFDGTDRDGKVTLSSPLHLRKVRVKSITSWLNDNSIWPTNFDPNAQLLYGTTNGDVKDRIRGNTAITSDFNSISSKSGYIPVRVTVEGDTFIAYPDTYGTPDVSKIRPIVGEVLTSVPAAIKNSDTIINTDTTQQLTSSSQFSADVFKTNSYATKFYPIIPGINGSLLRLYWYSSSLNRYTPLLPSEFEVTDPSKGLITVLTTAPSSYTQLLAEYCAIDESMGNTLSNTLISSIVPSGSSLSDLRGQIIASSKTPFITRNKTNYITGEVPTLTPPEFNKLSKKYYPIVEYYITSLGDVVFAKDFFKYGDIPAQITVEYESLNISPRMAVEIIRTSSSAATPNIHTLTLKVQEGSSTPIRSN